MNNNFNTLFKTLLPFAYILLTAYLFGFALFLYLPKSSIEFSKVDSYKTAKNRYNFIKAFDLKQKKALVKKKVITKKKEYKLSSNVELNAVYLSSPSKSWVVVNEKNTSKTYVLGTGESFKEYKLTSILKDHIVFEKNNAQYKLEMKTKKLNYEVLTQEDIKPKQTNEVKKLFKDVSLTPHDIKSNQSQKIGTNP